MITAVLRNVVGAVLTCKLARHSRLCGSPEIERIDASAGPVVGRALLCESEGQPSHGRGPAIRWLGILVPSTFLMHSFGSHSLKEMAGMLSSEPSPGKPDYADFPFVPYCRISDSDIPILLIVSSSFCPSHLVRESVGERGGLIQVSYTCRSFQPGTVHKQVQMRHWPGCRRI